LPSAYLTGRLKQGQPLQTEALGVVFLTAGLAVWAGLSFLIAGMTAGMIIANFAHHHSRAFHEIRNIEWPFMMLFFLLAGASFKVDAVASLGLIGAAYLASRVVGRLVGGRAGSTLAAEDPRYRNWFGPALLSQAGVAVGMALVAGREFPQYADVILTLTIGTTVVFELIGPLATVYALRRVGEANGS
jgi:Kef-type K+ transport system membrane component KefB